METKIAHVWAENLADDELDAYRTRLAQDAVADLREDGFDVLECAAEELPALFPGRAGSARLIVVKATVS